MSSNTLKIPTTSTTKTTVATTRTLTTSTVTTSRTSTTPTDLTKNTTTTSTVTTTTTSNTPTALTKNITTTSNLATTKSTITSLNSSVIPSIAVTTESSEVDPVNVTFYSKLHSQAEQTQSHNKELIIELTSAFSLVLIVIIITVIACRLRTRRRSAIDNTINQTRIHPNSSQETEISSDKPEIITHTSCHLDKTSSEFQKCGNGSNIGDLRHRYENIHLSFANSQAVPDCIHEGTMENETSLTGTYFLLEDDGIRDSIIHIENEVEIKHIPSDKMCEPITDSEISVYSNLKYISRQTMQLYDVLEDANRITSRHSNESRIVDNKDMDTIVFGHDTLVYEVAQNVQCSQNDSMQIDSSNVNHVGGTLFSMNEILENKDTLSDNYFVLEKNWGVDMQTYDFDHAGEGEIENVDQVNEYSKLRDASKISQNDYDTLTEITGTENINEYIYKVQDSSNISVT